MRKIIVLEFVTPDGVIQMPGGQRQDTGSNSNYCFLPIQSTLLIRSQAIPDTKECLMYRLFLIFAFFFIVGCEEKNTYTESLCNDPTPTAETLGNTSLTYLFSVKDKFDQEVSSFAVGEDAYLELKLTNNTDAILTYTTSNAGPGYSFAISKDCTEVWSSSYGMVYATVITDRTIAPKETLVFSEKWNTINNNGTPADPGKYSVKPNVDIFFDGKKLTPPDSKIINLY